VDEVIDHWPARCGVVEHRAQRLRCPECGKPTRAELPAEVAGSCFGPRLQAAVATLSVRNRVSREDAVELCEELFGCRISSGTIDAILARTARTLRKPHDDLLAALRASPALNMDETGWRTAGQRRALWGLFSQRHAYFTVQADRHEDRAKKLLAETEAIVTSDRWWAYAHLPLGRRQLCWAHLRRDFKAHAEGLAAEKEFGEAGLQLCETVFWAVLSDVLCGVGVTDRLVLPAGDLREARRASGDSQPAGRPRKDPHDHADQEAIAGYFGRGGSPEGARRPARRLAAGG
jgi:hypothetical protein